MKRFVRWLVVCTAAAILLLTCSFSYPFDSYSITYENDAILSAEAVKYGRTISGANLGIGDFRDPMCVRAAPDGRLLVADTGNHRVVVMDGQYQVQLILQAFERDGGEDSLKEPNGVFVTQDGDIYVADTGNGRILVFSPNGEFLREMPKPESPLFDDNFVYQPTSLVVDSAGRMYVIARNVNEGLMEFDENGEFKGFMGANRVSINAWQVLLRRFSTQEMLDRMEQTVPTEYSGIAIDTDGFIYVTTSTLSDSDIQSVIQSRSKDERYSPIRKLNASGTDVLQREGAFMPVGDTTYVSAVIDSSKPSGPSRLRDICVDESSFYAVLDTNRGHVFKYDDRGNLLFVFGGLSDTNGGFVTPVSLAQLEDRFLILDFGRRCLVEFQMTEYGEKIVDATLLYRNGRYEESRELWENVLQLNGNCETAYIGLGLVEYHDKNYAQAAEYFKRGQDRDNYSKAFSKYRNEVISEHFSEIIACVLILAGAFILLAAFFRLRRKYREIVEGYWSSRHREHPGKRL